MIQPGQKIHASVAFIQDYEPLAKFSERIEKGDWLRILCKGRQDSFEWSDKIKELLELDLFDHTRVKPLIEEIKRDVKLVRDLEFWTTRGANAPCSLG